jgi:hypothetical protein
MSHNLCMDFCIPIMYILLVFLLDLLLTHVGYVSACACEDGLGEVPVGREVFGDLLDSIDNGGLVSSDVDFGLFRGLVRRRDTSEVCTSSQNQVPERG